ncbi:MAG: AraC family transcriptional regulator [Alsobacter sp.]
MLSEVLRALRLTGAIFFNVEQRAPWVAHTPAGSEIASCVMPEADHVIMFHVVTAGGLWAEILDGSIPPIRVDAGEILIVPMADAHVLCSSQGMRTPANLAMYHLPKDRQLPFAISPGHSDGEPTHLICGYLGCDSKPFNPVLRCLPKLLHLKADETGGTSMQLLRMAVAESATPRAGGETVLSKIAELMFVDAVRRYADSLPGNASSWLAGLRDPQIGTALAFIHASPAEAWTVDELARRVALSRSVFAERFSHFMGESPMHYLAKWRMQLAARLLEQKGKGIAQVAAQVGYESEQAFNRAFKKFVGAPPGAWRRSHHIPTELAPVTAVTSAAPDVVIVH